MAFKAGHGDITGSAGSEFGLANSLYPCQCLIIKYIDFFLKRYAFGIWILVSLNIKLFSLFYYTLLKSAGTKQQLYDICLTVKLDTGIPLGMFPLFMPN
jgi:hypothetical protein